MISRIAIVGAGVMGCGIAADAVGRGIDVTLIDSGPEALAAAPGRILENERGNRLLRRTSAQSAIQKGKLALTPDLALCADAEAVIENITENYKQKTVVYEALGKVCHEDAIVVTNSSVIPIAELACHFVDAKRVVGIHFMNPVALKPVVEVIRSEHTSEDALNKAFLLLKALGKHGIVVGDHPGFISNRLLMVLVNEAIAAVADGVATPKSVDAIFRQCMGHKMGPLETADLIGLDTVRDSLLELFHRTGDLKHKPHPLLEDMVAGEKLGRKSSQGFYTYS